MALVSSQSSQLGSDCTQEFVEGRLLDGFLLLAAGGSSSPDDVVSVNLSSLQIVDVAADDLPFFAHVDRLDVSDNQLSYEQVLEQFGKLPRLSTLFLSCNAISSLHVPEGALLSLHALDLSFNELHGDVLAQLAKLPRLRTLSLASNCISSMPPEGHLEGFKDLEDLNLDGNDLVQFVQWRPLLALPRLRRLSLCSNRVKRLVDDAPTDASTVYFPALKELILTQNEIASMELLPVIKLFRSLKHLDLTNNPCAKSVGGGSSSARSADGSGKKKTVGAQVQALESKAWYLHGSSGCFMKRQKATEPKLKLNRQRMCRIHSTPTTAAKTPRTCQQLGVIDETTNKLVVSLQPGGSSKADTFLTAGPPTRASFEVVVGGERAARSDPKRLEVDDDLSEDDLDRILLERRKKIDRIFDSRVEEPSSYMRVPPFEVTAAAAKRLGFSKAGDDHSSSDDAVGATSARRHLAGSPASGRPSQPERRPSQPESLSLSLPPIRSESRGSSIALTSRPGSGSRDRPLKVGGRPKPSENDDVREAMSLLRAAAMSDFAVAV